MRFRNLTYSADLHKRTILQSSPVPPLQTPYELVMAQTRLIRPDVSMDVSIPRRRATNRLF